MNSNRINGHNGVRNGAAKPLLLRVLTPQQRGLCEIRYRGLRLYFSTDPDRVYTPLLRAGKLQLAVYADRFELRELDEAGRPRSLGSVWVDPAGQLWQHGEQLADEHGPVCLAAGRSNRYVKAELLFPEIAKVKKFNQFNPANTRAFFFYSNIEFLIPVDEEKKFGRAAREGRIQMVADRRSVDFYELAGGGLVIKYIGTIRIDPQGFLLLDGKRYLKNGEPVSINRSRRELAFVNVEDLIEAFAIKEIPVSLNKGNGRADAQWRGVVFAFSNDRRSIYYDDLAAGRLFMRVGFRDRIVIICRNPQKGEEKLGTIAIKAGNHLYSGVRLDQPDDRKKYFPVEKVVEELGGREHQVRLNFKTNEVVVGIHKIRFTFPIRDSYYWRDIYEERMACRVYRSYFVVGLKHNGEFTELGRVRFSSRHGRLLLNSRPCLYQGKPVMCGDQREPRIEIKELIPELGRVEKSLSLKKNSFVWRGIKFNCDLQEGDRYFTALREGSIKARLIGNRAELFVDRGQKEYIGSFSFDKHRRLLRELGKPAKTETAEGKMEQVLEKSHLAIDLSKLVSAFRFGPDGFKELEEVLGENDYNVIRDHLRGRDYRAWLKRLVLFAADYLGSAAPDPVLSVKLMFGLVYGLDSLMNNNAISPDLKQAFAGEIQRVMEKAVDNPALRHKREALRIQYRDALVLLNGGQLEETTE